MGSSKKHKTDKDRDGHREHKRKRRHKSRSPDREGRSRSRSPSHKKHKHDKKKDRKRERDYLEQIRADRYQPRAVTPPEVKPKVEEPPEGFEDGGKSIFFNLNGIWTIGPPDHWPQTIGPPNLRPLAP